MNLSKIKIKNFRLLKSFEMDIRDDISLVIGKNNSGKTSLLFALNKFINQSDRSKISYNDFSIETKQKLKEYIEREDVLENEERSVLENVAISLKLYIDYSEEDSLENIGKYILNLDSEEHTFILEYSLYLSYEKYKVLRTDFKAFKNENANREFEYFIDKHINEYYSYSIKVLESGNETNSIDIDKAKVDNIVCLKVISAKRDIDNEEYQRSSNTKSLSKFSAEYYRANKRRGSISLSELNGALQKADKELSDSYSVIFKDVIDNIDTFCKEGVAKPAFNVISAIKEDKLLADNTIVTYSHNGHTLPEDYNGLGYLNLIAIIYSIHLRIDEMKMRYVDTKAADINLLFIEEPEAHTHPQMQYVFIKNIKAMLSKQSSGINLQTFISTHSSHIVSQSDFNNIKYFLRCENNIIVKNLSDLESQYVALSDTEDLDDEQRKCLVQEKRQFEFLKKYLTLENSELFFAEKAIFIEGDSERILLPAMIQKLDNTITSDNKLVSQNISVVSVGAYAHIFDKFIRFLGIKTLIITDIDSAYSSRSKCAVKDGEITTNYAIQFFTNDSKLTELLKLSDSKRMMRYNNDSNKWEISAEEENSNLYLAFQSEENGVTGRSFEEAFISINFEFINDNRDNFELKNIEELDKEERDYYIIAEKCIEKKTSFATNILFYSDAAMNNWKVPKYIKDGLIWLSK